jgi:hypothetical protein
MVNCAMMSVDWRDLTWWQYNAMLTVWNERHEQTDGKRPPSDLTELRKNMAAATRIH